MYFVVIKGDQCINLCFFFFSQLENCPLDRKTFIVKQEEDYVINRVISQGEVIDFCMSEIRLGITQPFRQKYPRL